MAAYSDLNARPASSFLDASSFRTDWDVMRPECADQRYRDGLTVGAGANEVFVSTNGTWGSDNKDGSRTSSYEGIGYHAHTASFWRGVLESGCAVSVYRDGVKHSIK